ncbi:RNA polymerase sigma factor [Streptomyces sp. NPDC085524]|uniref:RNA polymerase sigma factor n=1 Tax=unclassified Streptomyces TaxID=2593676 RepID=UPI0035DAB646
MTGPHRGSRPEPHPGSRPAPDPVVPGGAPEPSSPGPASAVDEALLRELTPAVLGVLVRRGADFAAAEDAVQDALLDAVRVWPADPPRDPRGWLVTASWRRFLDAARADAARRRREDLVDREPEPGPAPDADDTLSLYFLCAHPTLSPSSAVALTLRAVGGLTTRQIARAYLVPEATMAQRISRAKRTVSGVRLDRPGDVGTVLRVLYLVFNEGYSGDVDLAAEAIRLTRRLAASVDHPEPAGLLALMLLHHARRAARTASDGSLVPLAEQDRSRWDTAAIAEGIGILHGALARDRLGEYQAQAAIAALHADARTAEETDWPQIVEWYDELVGLTGSPVARLNRAVAVGEADGPRAGLAALAGLDPDLPRYTAVAAWLHERDGDRAGAARLYAEAAHKAPTLAERTHLTRQAARLNAEATGPR